MVKLFKVLAVMLVLFSIGTSRVALGQTFIQDSISKEEVQKVVLADQRIIDLMSKNSLTFSSIFVNPTSHCVVGQKTQTVHTLYYGVSFEDNQCNTKSVSVYIKVYSTYNDPFNDLSLEEKEHISIVEIGKLMDGIPTNPCRAFTEDEAKSILKIFEEM